MTMNKDNISINYHDYMLDNSTTIDLSDPSLFYNTSNNTMYYTNQTGTIDTITIPTGGSSWGTYQGDLSSWSFPDLKDFEHTMPSLAKIEEMCEMYPAMQKAFDNFRTIYDLVKDDYEARKNGDK